MFPNADIHAYPVLSSHHPSFWCPTQLAFANICSSSFLALYLDRGHVSAFLYVTSLSIGYDRYPFIVSCLVLDQRVGFSRFILP
mmetsp:Transcript_8161/g.13984  ORF Transcript_8161/g.13984 Transcript_8161/m.13984 type:complete len:84 (-) Transcript_8161:323-574(-)